MQTNSTTYPCGNVGPGVFYYRNFGGGDPGSIYFANPLIKYNLPDQFYRDSLANKDKDIYVQTTIIDSVGNVNTIESVIPKAPQVYSYKVEEGSESNKKKITINYSFDLYPGNYLLEKMLLILLMSNWKREITCLMIKKLGMK